jgi:hypothetical protein
MAGKLSNRGGYRENAGRKSDWKHPATKTIRVPPEIADQVIDIAKQIDNAGMVGGIDLITESNESIFELDLDAIVQEVLSDPVVTRNGRDRGSVRRALEAMVSKLQERI